MLPAGKIPGGLLADLLGTIESNDPRVLLGPGTGHDSAAIAFGDLALVAKTDPITFPTERAAYHLVHINANDIACQGATPRWLLVTALLPAGKTAETEITALFEAIVEAATSIGVTVVGGHTEITTGIDRPLLVGTMLGDVPRDQLVRPGNARPGDRLLMTESAGLEGTAILAEMNVGGLPPADKSAAMNLIVNPGISVVRAARALHDAGAVSAMHDPTEGGIATAAREMAIAAGCDLVVSRQAVPLRDVTATLCRSAGVDPLGLLSSGSLLAAIPKDHMEAAERALTTAGIAFAWIGKLTPAGSGMRLRDGVDEISLPEFAVDELARVLGD